MPDVPLDWGKRLPPTTWPQNELQAPSGFGNLTEVDKLNALKVRREFFAIPIKKLGMAQNTSVTLNIPGPRDADFWICNLTLKGFDAAAHASRDLNAVVTLKDVSTNYEFFTPPVHVFALRNVNFGYYFKQWWAEPYCLLRNCALQISFQIFTMGGSVDLYGSFDGWKEYAHAAE